MFSVKGEGKSAFQKFVQGVEFGREGAGQWMGGRGTV